MRLYITSSTNNLDSSFFYYKYGSNTSGKCEKLTIRDAFNKAVQGCEGGSGFSCGMCKNGFFYNSLSIYAYHSLLYKDSNCTQKLLDYSESPLAVVFNSNTKMIALSTAYYNICDNLLNSISIDNSQEYVNGSTPAFYYISSSNTCNKVTVKMIYDTALSGRSGNTGSVDYCSNNNYIGSLLHGKIMYVRIYSDSSCKSILYSVSSSLYAVYNVLSKTVGISLGGYCAYNYIKIYDYSDVSNTSSKIDIPIVKAGSAPINNGKLLGNIGES